MEIKEDKPDRLPPIIVDNHGVTNLNNDVRYPREYVNHFESLLLSSQSIRSRIKALAIALSGKYDGKRILLVCTLKGAFPFCSRLCEELRNLRQVFDVEFMRPSSYCGTSSTGVVKMKGEMDMEVCQGRHVIICEDIVDTGTTLAALVPMVEREGKPASVEVCTLLDKRLASTAEAANKKYQAEYIGFSIPDLFVVGFGLDYNELYRDTDDIFVISQDGIDFDRRQIKYS